MTNKTNRRDFLKTSTLAGAGFWVASQNVWADNNTSPNERLNVAAIGGGGKGKSDITGAAGAGGNIVAICDVDERALARAKKDKVAEGAEVYSDYRAMLERKDIDAVVIGTPDHWHGVHFVHSAECGKHIYCEKPACCTIEESRAMVEAAQKAGIASQIGSQGRSQPEAYLMHRYLANGVIGDVSHVECFHYPSPIDDSGTPDSNPPPELDWDQWLGPLRWRPYNERYCPGKFRWMMESYLPVPGGVMRTRDRISTLREAIIPVTSPIGLALVPKTWSLTPGVPKPRI